MDYPKRKPTRLRDFDYSQNGAYFITVCTKGKEKLLSNIIPSPLPHVELTELGKITEKYIEHIPQKYPNVSVDACVIMPNHIHMILCLTAFNESGRQEAACPTVSNIVRSIKILLRKETGRSVFQDSFHDHIIRNHNDYEEIWKYIANNPAKWQEDSLYKV